MSSRYNPQRVSQARQGIVDQLQLSRLIQSYGIYMYGDKIVCPFHADDNPSCFVSDELKTYHCFGCGAKGTVVEFARDYVNLDSKRHYSQVEIIKELSEDFDIEIPDLEDKLLIQPKQEERKQRPIDEERVLKKRIEILEDKAKGIEDLKTRLKVYQVLDGYYFGLYDEGEAIKKIKGVW